LAVVLTKQTTKLVGQRVKAVEAPRVLLGKTTYADDIKLPNMLFVAFLRSSLPHARLLSVDFSNALKASGVLLAISGKDVAGQIEPFPIFAAPKGLRKASIHPIALNKARYAGEIVAAVVATDRYSAEDALEKIEVEYEPLDVLVDPEKAIDTDSVPIIDEWGTNNAYSTEVRAGDVESAISKADLVLRERFKIQRQYGSPMEPRSLVASYDEASETLTLWSSTQWPHIVRSVLAEMLKIGENRIRVVAPDVGGGFGNKQDVYPEEVLTAYLSIKLKRPVKWTASRSEDIISTVHARDQLHSIEVGVLKDGTIVGFKDSILADLGAFHIMSLGPQLVSVSALPGPYKIKNWLIRLTCVTTNKTPVGAYRGFGQSEANFVLERAVDIVARELKLDPVLVRLKNFIQPSELPYRNAIGATYDSGNYPLALRKALEISGYEQFKKHAKTKKFSHEALDGKYLGIGISFCVESTGIGPSKQMGLDGFKVYSGYDSATVRVERSGSVTILTGLCPHGQGGATTLAQVCADEFGIELEKVTVHHGDTRSDPYGFGTWGSRTAIIGSAAVKLSSSKVKEKAARIAAFVFGTRREDVEFLAGRFRSRNDTRKSLTLAEIAKIAYDAHNLPPGVEPGLEATTFYDPPGVAYSYQVHVPVVEVDSETGKVRILSYYVVHDCGVMINPTIVEGQVHGGIAQGIAGALLEELKYSQDGQLLSPTFIDYMLPTSLDVPNVSIEHMVTPTSLNPLGVKGMGEGGAIAPPAAIANAIDDALEPLGIRITETPVTPEALVSLIRSRGRRSS
jgi:carbon-monoxide dehydrogenase large subunit